MRVRPSCVNGESSVASHGAAEQCFASAGCSAQGSSCQLIDALWGAAEDVCSRLVSFDVHGRPHASMCTLWENKWGSKRRSESGVPIAV